MMTLVDSPDNAPEGVLDPELAADPIWSALAILQEHPYGKLDHDQMRAVVLEGWASGLRPMRALLTAGIEWDLLNLFIQMTTRGLEVVDLSGVQVRADIVAPFPLELAKSSHILPIWRDEHTVMAAVADISNMEALRELENRFPGLEIRLVLAEPSDIEAVADQLITEGEAANITEIATALEAAAAPQLISDDDDSDSDAAIVHLARGIVEQALNNRSSDIHIDPQPGRERGSVVRFRIDGVLTDVTTQDIRLHPPLTNYFKARAQMDIATQRLPQDGSYRLRVANGEPLNMRVATMPTGYRLGDTVLEKLTLRLVATDSTYVRIEELGFSSGVQQSFDRLMRHHSGMVVVTGPTGSGKTTTMYAALGRIATGDSNIMTIEDPIERRIAGANQAQVNVKAGMTYPAAMRGFLRHDPDVILIGEMRDVETARIAIEMALAGRLLLTSTHAPSAAGVIARLLSMGIEPYMVASSLQGILAQRLVRVLCPRCKQPEKFETIGTIRWPLPPERHPKQIFKAKVNGCVACKGTGFKGRVAVGEVLIMDEHIERLICIDTPTNEIAKYAQDQGMIPLSDDTLLKVASGVTSLDEWARVVATRS